MDHSPFRQTLELGIFISAAGKSILNLLNGEVWLQNIVKYAKYSPVKFANFVYFCIMRGKVSSHLESIQVTELSLFYDVQNSREKLSREFEPVD